MHCLHFITTSDCSLILLKDKSSENIRVHLKYEIFSFFKYDTAVDFHKSTNILKLCIFEILMRVLTQL